MLRANTEGQTRPGGATILTVDDNPTNLTVLLEVLESAGNSVLVATDGARALQIAGQACPDLILLDVMMPGMDGYEVCRRLRQQEATREIPVVFLTAKDGKEDVIAGFAVGGVDYITKPFQEEEVLARVATHVQVRRLAARLQETVAALTRKNDELEREVAQRRALKGQLSLIAQREAERWGLETLIGQSPTMRAVHDTIRLMQDAPRTWVLITGESGTGKELMARAIHYGSARRDGPFVPVNCTAIPDELVESALFGHVRGAFTGATADHPGYFAVAAGGTLFLDEVADMPLPAQGKLLRVLEDGQVWPVGAAQPAEVDVRVLAATNAVLRERLDGGTFRRDLYFRLARYTVEAPPLRQRREDIPLLAAHFLKLYAEEMGRDVPVLTVQARERLERYDFPGNVRELKNVVERALIESRGEPIEAGHLHLMGAGPTAPQDAEGSGPPPAAAAANGGAVLPGVPRSGAALPLDLSSASRQAERWVVEQAMARCEGNVSEAARLLRTSRNRIYRVLDRARGDAQEEG
ncbi:MAG: sigma-54 dependent transcriptional regulator [Candidatus Latescibacterota bacterium]